MRHGLACRFSAPAEATQELQQVGARPHSLRAFRGDSAEGQGPRLRRREEAERLVNCLLDEIASPLERGMRVELRGLGALNVRKSASGRGVIRAREKR
jgi:hypothetical protein